MNLRHYLLALILGDTAAWLSWLLIMLLVNPAESAVGIFIGFYATLFLSLLGLCTIILTVVRLRRHGEDDVEQCLRIGVRQGFFLSFLCVVALILSSMSLFSFWVMLLLLGVAGMIEYSYQSADAKRSG